jgi:hypothetical protein
MRNVFVLILLLLSAEMASAQSERSSFLFMLSGAGSRAASMGEAFTAVSGDAGAPYFNPASAGLMRSTEFSLMHVSYLTDATMEHASVLTRTGELHLGLGLFLGQTSDFERRDETPSENPLGTFDEHDFTASAYWAYPVSDRFSIGNALKWAYQKLDIESASAFAADIGIFYTLRPEIALGASARNLGTRPRFINQAYDLPREFRMGASYRPMPESRLGGLLVSGDFVIPHWGNQDSKINLGGEYLYQNLFALRAGYGIGYDSKGISLGGGLAYTNYYFDYAYVPSDNDLSDTHRLTLRIRL